MSTGGQIVPFKQKVADFRSVLDQMKGQLSIALPKHLNVDRMMRIVLTTVQRTPALLDCTQHSVFGSILQASQLGLEPDGILGEAYLIPYKQTCQLICGYKGLLKLARNSGQLSTIYARVVHQKDQFSYAFGIQDKLEHVPSLDPEPGDPTHVYAVARLKDGGVQFEVMSIREVNMIRARSKAANSGPWVSDFQEMAKKTVLRRLCKMLPASVELARAVVLDEQVDANLPQQFETMIDIGEAPKEEGKDGPAKTLDELAAKRATAPTDAKPAAAAKAKGGAKAAAKPAEEDPPEDQGDVPEHLREPGADDA